MKRQYKTLFYVVASIFSLILSYLTYRAIRYGLGGGEVREVELKQLYNNVGNLKAFDMRWKGVTGVSGEFLLFDSKKNGLRAMVKLLKNKIAGGFDTLSRLVPNYSPPHENNTAALVKIYQKANGGNNLVFGSDNFVNLVIAMVEKEKGFAVVTKTEVKAALEGLQNEA